MANDQLHQSLLCEDVHLLGKKTDDLYTRDGSVDFHGKPVLKRKTGNWKASYFIISNECAERLAYFGISLNLVTYLSSRLHEGNAAAARNVFAWSGTTYLSSIVGAFIADSYWGRYWTIVVFSILYFVGMCILTLSASIRALQPPDCVGQSCPSPTSIQYVVFFTSLYLVALGAGGIRPCISAFGANQFDETDPKERVQKGSFFNWFYFSVSAGSLLASTFIVWIQENIGWGIGFSVPTVFMGISIAIFLYGTPLYRFQRPRGSPLIRICQVVVASLRKWKLDVPLDSNELYGSSSLDSAFVGSGKLQHTNGLKCFDKASIITVSETETENRPQPWKLCTVTQVEETKILIRMIPIWLSTISYGIALAQVSTTFVEQGQLMHRSITPSLTVAAASLTLLEITSGMILVLLYDKLFVPTARRYTGRDRGLSELQRMGTGLLFSTLSMVSAAIVETKRLKSEKTGVGISILWQVPQYLFMGLADVFTYVGKMEFFYNQAPESMQSMCSAFVYVITALGSYASSLIVVIVTRVTSVNDGGGWIPNDLNHGHLDYYFWLLGCICFLDLLVYCFCALKYKPKKML